MTPTAAAPVRLQVTLQGTVQGVGFRPFLHRLATELGLAGWVHNSCQGLAVEGGVGALAFVGRECGRFRNRGSRC